MVDGNLEVLVGQRKEEAISKNLLFKAFDVANSLGKQDFSGDYDFLQGELKIHFSSQVKLDCNRIFREGARFFESFRHFNIDLFIRYNGDIVFKAKTIPMVDKDELKIEGYIPGEGAWEYQLNRLYEKLLKREIVEETKLITREESYLRQAFAL